MAESDFPDDEAAPPPGELDVVGEGEFDESEHTVVDSELGALLSEVVKDQARLGFDSKGTDVALEELGPAFPGGDDDLSALPGASSTRVLDESASFDPLEVDFDSSEVSLLSGPPSGEEPGESREDDWALPSEEDSRVDTVVRAWESLEDQEGDPELEEGGLGGVLAEKDPGFSPEIKNTNHSRADTGIYEAHEVPALRGRGRFVCVLGPVKGEEFSLTDGSTYIGRGVSNEIVVKDASVSRIHAVVHGRDGGISILDKESNNGVLVNGEKVHEAVLSSGDEVVLGNVVFRFLEEGDLFKGVDVEEVGPLVTPAVKEPERRGLRARSYFSSLVVSGVLVTLTVAGVGGILWSRRSVEPRQAQSDVIFQHYLSGIDAFKSHNWDRAKSQFGILVQLAPGDERGERYLEAIKVEREAQDKLALARGHRSRGELKEAYGVAGKITDSIYFYDEARELVSTIDGELDAQVARARTSIAVGQHAEGLSLLARVEAVRPGRPEVAALRDEANRALKPARASKKLRPATAAGEGAGSAKPARAKRNSDFKGPLGKARRMFVEGDTSGALGLLAGLGSEGDARTLGEQIRSFERSYRMGAEAHRAKRWEIGIKHLTGALQLEREIIGGTSVLTGSIRRKLADLFYVRAQQAMSRSKWPVAYQAFNQAMEYVPNYKRAESGLAALEKKAIELFNEGDVVRESDPAYAKERWREVLKIVKPGHPYYVKAKARLSRMR